NLVDLVGAAGGGGDGGLMAGAEELHLHAVARGAGVLGGHCDLVRRIIQGDAEVGVVGGDVGKNAADRVVGGVRVGVVADHDAAVVGEERGIGDRGGGDSRAVVNAARGDGERAGVRAAGEGKLRAVAGGAVGLRCDRELVRGVVQRHGEMVVRV